MIPVLPNDNLTSTYDGRPHAPKKEYPRPHTHKIPHHPPVSARTHSESEKEKNVRARRRHMVMPRNVKKWSVELDSESRLFMQAYADCKRQLAAVDEYIKNAPADEEILVKGEPNMLRTAVVSDLLMKMTNSVTRFRSLFRPIIQVLLEAVYRNYDASNPSIQNESNKIIPFFTVARRLDKQYESLDTQLRVWADNQQTMESEELVRMLVVNRIATNYQIAIQNHAFLRWRYVVTRRKNQRRGLQNILDRIVEPSGIAYKRQLMHIWRVNILQNKYQRLKSQSKKSTQDQKKLRLKLRELKDTLETCISETKDLLSDSKKIDVEYKQLTDRVERTKMNIVEFEKSPELEKTEIVLSMWISSLNALESQLQVAKFLNLQDIGRMFRSEPALIDSHPVGTKEWVNDCKNELIMIEKRLNNMSENDIILLWVNYHLHEYQLIEEYKCGEQTPSHSRKKIEHSRINLDRRIDNFSTCFEDGEILCTLLCQIAPKDIDRMKLLEILSNIEHEKRAKQLLDIIKSFNPILYKLKLVTMDDLSLSLYPDMLAAFLGCLFIDRPNMPLCTPDEWFGENDNRIIMEEIKPVHVVDNIDNVPVASTTPHQLQSDTNETVKIIESLYEEQKNRLSNTPLGHLLDEILLFHSKLENDVEIEVLKNQHIFHERVTTIMEALPLVLEVAYMRNRLWERMQHRIRCFIVHVLSSRARNRPLCMTNHKDLMRRNRETSFLDKEGNVLPIFADLALSSKSIVHKKGHHHHNIPEVKLSVEDVAASNIDDKFNHSKDSVEIENNEKLKDKNNATNNNEEDDELDGPTSIDELNDTDMHILSSELKTCQEIILFHYETLQGIFQRYAQADTNDSNVSDKALTMNNHELWIFIRETGLARNKHVVAHVDGLFKLVLKHKSSIRFGNDIKKEHVAQDSLLSSHDISHKTTKKNYDEFQRNTEGNTDIQFCQFVEFLIRLARIRSITASELKTVDEKWHDMKFNMIQQKFITLSESFIALHERSKQLNETTRSNEESELKRHGLALRLFALLTYNIIPKSARLNVNMFRNQFVDSDVGKVFRSRRKELVKIFHLYSVSKTIVVNITGSKEELWSNTMDYSEFLKLLKDAKLLGEKNLTPAEVFSIFTNVQSEAQAPKNPHTKNINTADAKKKKISEVAEVEGEDMIYSEFLEALAAIATFLLPNPYIGMSTRLVQFLDQMLLPWARQWLFRKMTKAEKNMFKNI